jgi:hypothetical protein
MSPPRGRTPRTLIFGVSLARIAAQKLDRHVRWEMDLQPLAQHHSVSLAIRVEEEALESA